MLTLFLVKMTEGCKLNFLLSEIPINSPQNWIDLPNQQSPLGWPQDLGLQYMSVWCLLSVFAHEKVTFCSLGQEVEFQGMFFEKHLPTCVSITQF